MGTEINGELLINLKSILGSSVVAPVSGSLTMVPSTDPVTETLIRIPVQTTNFILKASDPNRLGLTIWNNSSAAMYVKLGASIVVLSGGESFTRIIPSGGYWEIPFNYTGRVDVMWAAADATGEALVYERFTGTTPLSITGYQAWLRADQGVSSGGVALWADLSGNNHNYEQATAGSRPSFTASIINGQPVVRFSVGKALACTPWTQPTIVSMYAVFKMVTKVDQFQLFSFGVTANSYYIGGRTMSGIGLNNRPVIYSGTAGVASWSADLVNGTNYICRWQSNRTNAAAIVFTTKVNNSTEVLELGPGTSSDQFQGLGILGVSQDLVSDIAEMVTYNKFLSASEETTLYNYFNTRYAIY